MSASLINLLIVDDSPVIQKVLEKILKKDSFINIVAFANNGKEAIEKVSQYQNIDLVLLDIEMPIMGGIESIPYLLEKNPKLKIIIVSSLAAPQAKYTVKALSLGAVDYVEKPNSKITLEQFGNNLIEKIKLIGLSTYIKEIYDPINKSCSLSVVNQEELIKKRAGPFKPSIIAIASSTGGPSALIEVLGSLSERFISDNIIVITQHIRDNFIDLLVSNLNSIGKLSCKRAADNEELKKGVIYLAPGNAHLEINYNRGKLFTHLSDAPPENFCRPSADPMFNSLAKLPIKTLAIVLTGIGLDGLKGGVSLAEKGKIIIAQDQDTSVVWGMPGAVAKAGICSAILPIYKIASYIERELF